MRKKIIPFGVGLLLLAGGLIAWQLVSKRSEAVRDLPVTYSTDAPSEKPINPQTYKWSGGPKDPKLLTMPSIDTEVFIQKVGIDQRQQVAVPTNVHLAGWFVNSARPGAKGLSIIDGHVDGRTTQNAAFGKLDQLKAGDRFSVEYGDGTNAHFQIKQLQTVTADEAVNVLFSQDPSIKSQLNLVTCTGTFDRKSKTYNQRIIVISQKL